MTEILGTLSFQRALHGLNGSRRAVVALPLRTKKTTQAQAGDCERKLIADAASNHRPAFWYLSLRLACVFVARLCAEGSGMVG